MLRYLADAYKALRQTVPEEAKTEELIDLEEWLGELVRQVDSSLIDEWEQLRNPTDDDTALAVDAPPPAVTRNVRAFRVLVRNALFRRVELAALGRYDELGELDGESGWDADAWRDGDRGLLRRVRRPRCRSGRPRPGARRDHDRPDDVDGAADVRRSGRRPRLGHRRRDRPRSIRRAGCRRRYALSTSDRTRKPSVGERSTRHKGDRKIVPEGGS